MSKIFLQAVLGKNALGLPSLAYAPRALPGWVGGLYGLWMAYDMSLHTFERLSCSHDSTRTHRRKHCQIAQATESQTPRRRSPSCASTSSAAPPANQAKATRLFNTRSTIHMSEHSIITFHACSKPGAKYSSLEEEEEELASSLREDVQIIFSSVAPCSPSVS